MGAPRRPIALWIMLHVSLTRDRDIDPNLPFTPSGEIFGIKEYSAYVLMAQRKTVERIYIRPQQRLRKGAWQAIQVEKHTG